MSLGPWCVHLTQLFFISFLRLWTRVSSSGSTCRAAWKKQHRGNFLLVATGLTGERCNVCISLRHSCPPSWWWTFPTERWHRPQPRPGGTPRRAGRTAASAPSARLPPRRCWSSREWCPAARSGNKYTNETFEVQTQSDLVSGAVTRLACSTSSLRNLPSSVDSLFVQT